MVRGGSTWDGAETARKDGAAPCGINAIQARGSQRDQIRLGGQVAGTSDDNRVKPAPITILRVIEWDILHSNNLPQEPICRRADLLRSRSATGSIKSTNLKSLLHQPLHHGAAMSR